MNTEPNPMFNEFGVLNSEHVENHPIYKTRKILWNSTLDLLTQMVDEGYSLAEIRALTQVLTSEIECAASQIILCSAMKRKKSQQLKK